MLIARRSVLIGLGLAGLVPAAASAALEIVEAGTVEAVTGESIGKLRGEKRALAVGSPVFIDDLLQTSVGARLGVKLGEATRVSLGESTLWPYCNSSVASPARSASIAPATSPPAS